MARFGRSFDTASAGYTGCGSYVSLGYVRAHNRWGNFTYGRRH